MRTLTQFLDDTRIDNGKDSLGHRLRARRFAAFDNALSSLPRPVRIIDIGGTVAFWEQRGWADRDGVDITLVNVEPQESPYANVHTVVADAADLAIFPAQAFDAAFSNSVIEHVGNIERQAAMAREVRRVARTYWVQTPNFWFPMEPHYLILGWQWLPERVRVAILRRHGIGRLERRPDVADAQLVVQRIKLLRRSQIQTMFPDARLVPERFAGLVKSWTAVSGLPVDKSGARGSAPAPQR